MKIVYDPSADLLQITLRSDVVDETTQVSPGLVLDYDAEGQLSGIEIHQASAKISNPYAIAFEVGSANQDKPRPRTHPQLSDG